MTIDRPTPVPLAKPLDWVVVANAARARVFERDDGNGALREIADPVHPAGREKPSARGRDRPGRVHQGVTSTAFAPHTAPRELERKRFAHELARLLEGPALAGRVPGLVLMASNPFLGELKAALGPAAGALLTAGIAVDLTWAQGADLERRVSQLLALRAQSVEPAPATLSSASSRVP